MMKITDTNLTTVSAVVYTTGALLAAFAFFVVAFAADYNWVARVGGAGWVFALSMVILMPTVPALLRGRVRAGGEAADAGQKAIVQKGGNMLVKDPVCGMEIDSESAAGFSEYEGQTYYFCNLNCKESFDAEPDKYAKGALQ